MQDLRTKQSVLQEIMDLMDKRDGDRLKSHPKVAAKFAAPKEEVLEESELPVEDEALESEESTEGELSEEDMQLLLEKLKELE